MGIHFKDIKYFEEITDWLKYKKYIGNLNGLRLCEIGDLWIRADLHNYMKHRLASQYFEAKGLDVSVIDLGVGTESIEASEKRMNGKILRYDLGKPIIEDIGNFDFIVDFGTAEHIENQYELHRNMHNLCDVNSIMIRSNPSDKYSGGDSSKHHGLFHYTSAFYIKLSRICNYEIIDIREMKQKYSSINVPGRKNFTYVTLVKSKNNIFPSLEIFNRIVGELGRYEK